MDRVTGGALVVRAERDKVVACLRRLVGLSSCSVAPARTDGWVAIQLAYDVSPNSIASALSVEFDTPVIGSGLDDEPTMWLQIWRHGTEAVSYPMDLNGGVTRERTSAEFARQIAVGLGTYSVEEQLAELLEHTDLIWDDQLRPILGLLGLPLTLLVLPAEREVIVFPGTVESAERCATKSGYDRLWLVCAQDGWNFVASAGGQPALGLAMSLAEEDDPAWPLLHLWWGEDQTGYVLYQRGDELDRHCWRPEWTHLGKDVQPGSELLPDHGDATKLATALGRPYLEDDLQAMLDAGGDGPDLLRSFVYRVGLPTEAVEVLSGRVDPERLPNARSVDELKKAATASAYEEFHYRSWPRDGPRQYPAYRRYLWHVWAGLAFLVVLLPGYVMYAQIAGRYASLPVVRIEAGWCYYQWPGSPPVTSDDAGDLCPADTKVGDLRRVWISSDDVLYNESPLETSLVPVLVTSLAAAGLLSLSVRSRARHRRAGASTKGRRCEPSGQELDTSRVQTMRGDLN